MSSENRGLGLFDETASAAGNFPSALRGYDRSAVDDYIRTLEGKTNEHRRKTDDLQQQVALLQNQLAELKSSSDSGEVDINDLGGRASEILRLAQEQAHETKERATTDADRLREEARQEAERIRTAADRDGAALKNGGLAEIAEVRTKIEEQGKAHAERSQAENEALLAAARRQAESVRHEAEHEAETMRQQAYLDTEELRRRVEREVADTRQSLAAEKEAALAELKRSQEEAAATTKRLLAEAVQHNADSAQRLNTDIEQAAQLRADATANADKVKLAAVKDAEERLADARRQSEAIAERTHKEFAWRKEQLRRETDLLGQRKQAVLNQLASLTQLAQQTAAGFPELDDARGFDAEQGDHTVLRSDQEPALPKNDGATKADAPNEDDLETDGDATIMAPQGLFPAGTEHLQGQHEASATDASATEGDAEASDEVVTPESDSAEASDRAKAPAAKSADTEDDKVKSKSSS